MFENRPKLPYFAYMDTQTLSSTSLLVLAALADRPMHAYAIREYITKITFWQTRPQASSIRSALHRFEQTGWVRVAWRETGSASHNSRVVFEITRDGWHKLRAERQRLDFVIQWVDRVEARQLAALGSAGAGHLRLKITSL